jgi:hypothetical protein
MIPIHNIDLHNNGNVLQVVSNAIRSEFKNQKIDLLTTNTYYKPGTPSNADFELYLTRQMVTVDTAKKSRMSYKQIKCFILPYVDQRSKD